MISISAILTATNKLYATHGTEEPLREPSEEIDIPIYEEEAPQPGQIEPSTEPKEPDFFECDDDYGVFD